MLKSSFHNVIDKHISLYLLYYYCIRIHRGDRVNLPSRTDDIYVDAYPRSGNTFLVRIINDCFGRNLTLNAHHLHSIAGAKMALKKRIKTFIIIRNPADSISSFLIMKKFEDRGNTEDLQQISFLTRRYINYYNFIKSELKNIYLIDFKDLILDPLSILLKIQSIYGLDIDTETIRHRYLQSYKNLKTEQRSNPKALTSLPDHQRNLTKSQIREEVENSNFIDQALALYLNLIDEKI